jgi:hypothetical protein
LCVLDLVRQPAFACTAFRASSQSRQGVSESHWFRAHWEEGARGGGVRLSRTPDGRDRRAFRVRQLTGNPSRHSLCEASRSVAAALERGRNVRPETPSGHHAPCQRMPLPPDPRAIPAGAASRGARSGWEGLWERPWDRVRGARNKTEQNG